MNWENLKLNLIIHFIRIKNKILILEEFLIKVVLKIIWIIPDKIKAKEGWKMKDKNDLIIIRPVKMFQN